MRFCNRLRPMSAATCHVKQASANVPEPAQAFATANDMATGAWEQGPLELERLRERARFYALRAHAAADLIGEIPAVAPAIDKDTCL